MPLYNGRSWTEDQKTYMLWLIVPAARRQPKTMEELAHLLGYNPKSMWDWTQKPGWDEAKNKLALYRLVKKLPDIYQALEQDLLSHDGWQARRDFFRYVMPTLTKAQEAGYFDELNETTNLLPQATVLEKLAVFNQDEQDKFIGLLNELQVTSQLPQSQLTSKEENTATPEITLPRIQVELDGSEHKVFSLVADSIPNHLNTANRKHKVGRPKRNSVL